METKLIVAIGVHNQFELSGEMIKLLAKHSTVPQDVGVVVVDNGSSSPFSLFMYGAGNEELVNYTRRFGSFEIIRNDQNTGNYPIFKQVSDAMPEDRIIAFFHSDLLVYQDGWDERIIREFNDNPDHALIGFIGSTELDSFGGRGSGTRSNFMNGVTPKPSGGAWTGSPAEAHGMRITGLELYGSVVDGCAMIFRNQVLRKIEHMQGFPPHHFYDRMMCAQVIELGYRVGILGIECDHVSGQTANHEQGWSDTAKEWCEKYLGITEKEQWISLNREWWESTSNPSRGHQPNGWDHVIYMEAERQFLRLFRDVKHIVPIVNGKRIN